MKKIIVGAESFLMIVSIFAFSYLMSIPSILAEELPGCCSLNIDGEKCGTSYRTNCEGEFAEGSLCSATSFCEKGCCYNSDLGIFDKNVLKSDCKNEWVRDPNCNLPGAVQGCCVLGETTIFETLGQCETDTKIRAIGASTTVDWRKINELQCLQLSGTEKEGACVLAGGNCKVVSEVECLNYNGDFSEGFLCTSKKLNTSCEKTDQTTCIEGKDGVYFLDSCGNKANIYDFSKLNNQEYWEKIVSLENSCLFTNGNANSKTCGNCNRFLGGICDSATSNNFNVNSGNFYCKATSCTFKGETYKNGENWCVYDGAVGNGDDVVGSRHWKYVCNNGEIQVEPCADYRNEICIQSNTAEINGTKIEFRNSACVVNNWRECISLNSEEDGLQKCAETLNCRIEKVDIADNFDFEICTPKYPAGFDLKNERYQSIAKSICGMANQKCTVVYKPKFTGGCEIEYNKDCLSEEFGQKMNDFCRGLGDCGGEVNILGEYSENYKITKSPKLSQSWIAKLKGLATPIQGQIAEVENYAKYLEAAGVIKTQNEVENYNVDEDLMKLGTGVAGIGYAMGVVAVASYYGVGLSTLTLEGLGTASVWQSSLGSTLAPFSGAAIGAGIGMIAGMYLAKVLKLAPMGSILMSIGGGIVGGVLGYEMVLQTTLNPIFFWVGVALIVFSLFFGSNDCKPKIVEFECKPWQPPKGGSNCEECNGDSLKPCSEYRCSSLGAACELINKGTAEELCIDKNPDDTTPPTITPQYGVISENEKYNQITDKGFKISSSTSECIDAYTDLEFGIQTNEPAQCKFDLQTKNFEDMEFDIGGNNFLYNHTTIFTLPDPSHGQSQGGNWTGELDLYIKCQDTHGHENPDFYTINLCVKEGPDKTPPRIKSLNPGNNELISFDKTETSSQIITNELSECRWDIADKDYSLMSNQMICDKDLLSPSSTLGYMCSTALALASSENIFYVRCIDQPWLNGTGNANTQSFLYTLKKPGNKIAIDEVLPNEDFKSSTTFSSIELQVKTSGGGIRHICSYSFSGYEKTIEFFETGESNIHKQPLNVRSSTNKIFIECTDETGDYARSETEFKINFDSSSPQISRVWRGENTLNFITNEKAECSYSEKSCLMNSNEKTTQLSETHKIEISTGKNYYIKCTDEFGNTPTGCSLIINPV
ncbi:MAG: hypothetical protein WC548_02940 [Candidatus Pacearchaeota archaeon]